MCIAKVLSSAARTGLFVCQSVTSIAKFNLGLFEGKFNFGKFQLNFLGSFFQSKVLIFRADFGKYVKRSYDAYSSNYPSYLLVSRNLTA